jgi:predicted O-methyltransferase YrrM
MRAFQLSWQTRANKQDQIQAPSASFYSMWDAVARFAKEIRASEFMSDMIRRRDAYGSEGVMGALDCATLYALTRWLRPEIIVESGGFIGMSSAFILKALADEGLATSKLYSIELSEDCEQGALIPEELRSLPGFVPMRGRIEDFLKGDELPGQIDMFLHDSSHSYRHMLWEFGQFWPRLRDGGLLVSHDVQMNAAFPEFVTKTYAHEKKTGRRDAQRTTHHEWGRWGYLGFAIKKN